VKWTCPERHASSHIHQETQNNRQVCLFRCSWHHGEKCPSAVFVGHSSHNTSFRAGGGGHLLYYETWSDRETAQSLCHVVWCLVLCAYNYLVLLTCVYRVPTLYMQLFYLWLINKILFSLLISMTYLSHFKTTWYSQVFHDSRNQPSQKQKPQTHKMCQTNFKW